MSFWSTMMSLKHNDIWICNEYADGFTIYDLMYLLFRWEDLQRSLSRKGKDIKGKWVSYNLQVTTDFYGHFWDRLLSIIHFITLLSFYLYIRSCLDFLVQPFDFHFPFLASLLLFHLITVLHILSSPSPTYRPTH